jgi:asparagine synthase (glutamine-hydrolysing)
MCGFFGALGRIASEKSLNRSLTLLQHRGPDASACWASHSRLVWLGHTRLAILDLSDAGRQPMEDPHNGNVIVFNGEIYNHLEIRRELELLGLVFRGNSDTETLLKGFGVWGTELFARLRGMFALAIFDRKSESVVLARDRLGIKPLYLGQAPTGDLLFSSEVRALLPWAGRDLSPEGVASYLQMGCCSHRQILFKNISEFPAGCWARVRSQDHVFKPMVFWPTTSSNFMISGQSGSAKPDFGSRKQVRTLLTDAVQSHLLSDVPVACFLSGGMDSSILAALASQAAPTRRLTTFSVGFAEASHDESEYAEQVATTLGTDHHHIELFEGEKLEMVSAAVTHMDLPTIDGINTFLVSREAARAGFKVVLSGLGADEVFGGYPVFRDYAWIRLLAGTPRMIQAAGKLLRPSFHLFTDIPADKTGQALSWWWRRIWNGDELAKIGLNAPSFRRTPGPSLRDAMAEISWGEISGYLRDMLLRDSDAMSMAHSLELRVPFLDNALFEYVLSLPAGIKFSPDVPKFLLLEATRDLLPQQSWNRPKMGFSLPMESWMRRPLRDFCKAGADQAGNHLGLDRSQNSQLWSAWEKGRLGWPKMWAWVVLGHYLEHS